MTSEPQHRDPDAASPEEHELTEEGLEEAAGGVQPGGCIEPVLPWPNDPIEPLGGDILL